MKSKLLILLTILFFIVSCSKKEESNNDISGVKNNPPPLINYNLEDLNIEFPDNKINTNSLQSNIRVESNLSFSQISFFQNSDCSEEIGNSIFLNYNANYKIQNYSLNNKVDIFYIVQLNEEISDCLNTNISLTHDNIKPNYPEISQFINDNYQGKTISNTTILVGGEESDLSNDTSKIQFYKDFEGTQLIGEFSINDYLTKSIPITLNINQWNTFYLRAVDYFNNVSDTNPYSILIEQSVASGIVNKPILSQEIQNLNNGYTSSLILNIKGFLDENTLYFNVYSDSNKNNLIKQVSKNTFLNSGLDLDLNENALNSFWFSASNDTLESNLISFNVNQDSSTPNKPILDQSILDAHNQTIDVVNAQIFGSVPQSIEFVQIYDNPDLLNGPIYSISRNDFNNNTGVPLSLNFGNNYLYFVSVNFDNIKSEYIYIQVFVEE